MTSPSPGCPDARIAAFVDQVLADASVPARVRREARDDFIVHLEAEVARRVRAGVPADRAIDEAILAFGSPTNVRRALERANGASRAAARRTWRARHVRRRAGYVVLSAGDRLRAGLDALRRDVSYGLRSLRRRPLPSAAAIATLAIGIGLNAAVFSVVDWVLFRPMPYPSPHELVRVFSAGAAPVTAGTALAYSEFLTLSRAPAFRAAASFSTATRIMGGQGLDPAHVVVARVAGDLFGTLGAHPVIGRGFVQQEVGAGAAVVVVSQALWRSRLSADPAIVERAITIDGHPHTVVGVMPAGLGYPPEADLWRPLTAEEREDDDREYVMIGRLTSGISPERANVEIATLARAASSHARTAWVEDVQRAEVRDVRAGLTALLGSAALVLLMACANVAALIGAQGADRVGEMAVRGALGASRTRLVRQLLTESLLLAAAGGAAGLVVGRWTLDLLVSLAPGGLPRLAEIALDSRIVAAGVGATAIVGVIVGLAPSVRASRLELRACLGIGGSSRASGRTKGRGVLVAAQTAMAVCLTIGAGLLARSLQHLVTIDHGFAPDRLLAVQLDPRFGIVGDGRDLFRALVAQAQTVPGVRSAAVAFRLPTEIAGLRVPVRMQGIASGTTTATLRPVTPRYFETAGIPLTDGRAFSDDDRRNALQVAIVNAAFVREVLHGGPAIGATLSTDLVKGNLSIVGVVANVTPAGQADRAALYLPMDQIAVWGGSLLVRTEGDPRLVVPALTTRLRAVAPGLALDRIHRVAAALEAGRAVTRFNTQVASAFGVLALLLSVIGVYGLTAGEVAARWRELAVRLALGAPRREALWTVMRPGARALMAGVVFGVAATLVVGR